MVRSTGNLSSTDKCVNVVTDTLYTQPILCDLKNTRVI